MEFQQLYLFLQTFIPVQSSLFARFTVIASPNNFYFLLKSFPKGACSLLKLIFMFDFFSSSPTTISPHLQQKFPVQNAYEKNADGSGSSNLITSISQFLCIFLIDLHACTQLQVMSDAKSLEIAKLLRRIYALPFELRLQSWPLTKLCTLIEVKKSFSIMNAIVEDPVVC